jgi:arginase
LYDKISVLGIKMDLGRRKRGADKEPETVRKFGLLKEIEASSREVKDFGDISTELSDKINLDNNLEFNIKDAIPDFKKISTFVSSAVEDNYFPLILGGDHSISIGTISGIAKYFNNLGVIWCDAHGDVNTPETTITGSINGMPLAASLGYGDKEIINIDGYMPKVKIQNVVFVGIRELDPEEEKFIADKKLKIFTIKDIQEIGIEDVIKEAIDYLKEKCDGIHLSFDLDAIDPNDAPGVRTPVKNGLSYDESIKALSILRDSELITSAEFVELNPFEDIDNKTAKVTIDLIKTLIA